EINKIANRYEPHSKIRILKPPQLKGINKEEINSKNDISLKLANFVYDQLCKFNPKKEKGKAIYVTIFEFFKKYVIGEMNPASCADVAYMLKEARKQELEEDITASLALETYIPLQANNYPYTDNNDNKNNNAYDCHQYVLDLLEEKEEKQSASQRQQVVVLQGKSGSGKSLFCRHLEENLWESYVNGSTVSVPVYISLPKCYHELNEKQIISQALQTKKISKEIIDTVRENVSFVFILDGFDEIFDKYNKNINERYFYDCFNLSEWNAKIIVTCRSHVLDDEDIKHVLIGPNNTITSMVHLWPFSKVQMYGYIDKFVKMNKKNKLNEHLDWTIRQYEEILNNYPNLHKMMEEPFLLRMILTVLPSLMKQHSIGTKISKAQVYEAFNEQWIDIHGENIANKLSELRIQTNLQKIKSSFRQYCQDLGFEMFIQGNQVATENSDIRYDDDEILSKLDPIMEMASKHVDEKLDIQTTDETSDTSAEKKKQRFWKKYFNNSNVTKDVPKRNENDKNQIIKETTETKINEITSIENKQDIWEKYFSGDSIAKYVLRKVSHNKYQFLHKSCQEYYAAQKIIFDIISWKPSIVGDINNQQFQQQFEINVPKLFINCKLLNEELGVIQFIAERIYDTNPIFTNLKSRLFRIIEASKNNENVCIAAANAITVLNSANVNMHNREWSNIKIPHAILDHAFLEGTNFSNANLNNVSFYQTCLNKTDFTNASMNGIYFGEYAYLQGHSSTVTCVQFSPDGSKIVSCSRDKTIRVWDTMSGKQLQLSEGHSNKTIRLWDILSGQQIQIYEGHTHFVNAIYFSPDGSKIISCAWDNTIRIWDVFLENKFIVIGILFSPDGSKIISYSNDKTIRVWDVLSGKQLQVLEGHSKDVLGVQFASNRSQILSCSEDKTIRVWDLSSGQQVQVLEGHTSGINGIQLSADGSTLLSYSWDNTLRIWNLLSGKQIQVLEGHSDNIKTAKLSPDCSRVISGSVDKTVRIWDVSSGKQLQVLEGHADTVNGVEFFPKDPKILSYSEDGTIRIWDIGIERKIRLTEGHFDSIADAQFSPDNSKIVSCSLDKTIRLWDIQSKRQIHIFEGHTNYVRGVIFSGDGLNVISYSDDKTIRIWDVLSGK
ncbi:hypothetical protein RFI_28886, partial [Reticulomyxa filosa]